MLIHVGVFCIVLLCVAVVDDLVASGRARGVCVCVRVFVCVRVRACV